jgi:hypothetical protein
MSVVFQAKSAAPSAFEGVTSFNKTNMTVAVGANRVMLVFLNFVSGIDYPGTVSMAWNVQGATLIDSYNTSTGGQFTSIQLWGLVNPAVGALTLAANWATTADVVVECISVTGALQTGGTATFSGAAHNEDLSVDTSSLAIASNAGDLVVGHFSNPRRAFTSTNQTNIFMISAGAGAQNVAANRAAGASPTVTMTATAVGAVSSFLTQGVNIVQGAPPPTQALTPALYVDTDTFRTPDVPRVLTPGLYTDTDTFTTHVVSGFLSDNLFQSKVTDTDTFRTHVVTTGGVNIAPALYRDEDVLGTHEVAIVPVSVAGVTQMLARSGPRRQR